MASVQLFCAWRSAFNNKMLLRIGKVNERIKSVSIASLQLMFRNLIEYSIQHFQNSWTNNFVQIKAVFYRLNVVVPLLGNREPMN